mmetsp:Transcript_11830/g.41429  ORF Transcript_11830/g.41429 Transcript_11830/m.41429 type:complete len:276 (+) Transcript_11830:1270-2097(+)
MERRRRAARRERRIGLARALGWPRRRRRVATRHDGGRRRRQRRRADRCGNASSSDRQRRWPLRQGSAMVAVGVSSAVVVAATRRARGGRRRAIGRLWRIPTTSTTTSATATATATCAAATALVSGSGAATLANRVAAGATTVLHLVVVRRLDLEARQVLWLGDDGLSPEEVVRQGLAGRDTLLRIQLQHPIHQVECLRVDVPELAHLLPAARHRLQRAQQAPKRTLRMVGPALHRRRAEHPPDALELLGLRLVHEHGAAAQQLQEHEAGSPDVDR